MQPSAKEITIEINSDSPRFLMFFDEYAIRRGARFTDLDFRSKRSGKSISIKADNALIELNKKGFLEYMAQCGNAETPKPPKPTTGSSEDAIFCDVIGLARHGNIAEILMSCISWKVAVDKSRAKRDAKAKESVSAICVALLRCELDIQLHWIAGLYDQ